MGSRGYIAVVVVGCVVALAALLMASVLEMHYRSRQSPRRQAPSPNNPNPNPPVTVRLRVVNMFMLPFMHVGRKLNTAVQQGVLQDVDFILMQEMFRRAWFLPDGARTMAQTSGQVAVVELPVRRWSLTDSGLAVAATGLNRVQFVAFEGFAEQRYSDKMSHKGVAIFRLNDAVNIAVTHLQASYSKRRAASDDALRLRQFHVCLATARRHNAVILAGDFNVFEPGVLDEMDSAVNSVTLGKGKRLADDGLPTFGLRGGSSPGVKIDHCWILDTTVVRALGIGQTNRNVTRGWSDHAAIDFVVEMRAQ